MSVHQRHLLRDARRPRRRAWLVAATLACVVVLAAREGAFAAAPLAGMAADAAAISDPSAGSGVSAIAKSFAPAAIHAAPGLRCRLYPTGGDAAKAVTVFTDADGYARFHAVRAATGEAVRTVAMDCANAVGQTSAFTGDLAADDMFVARPLDLEKEPGVDRPALTGDPLAYPQSVLTKAGFGLRPNPADHAAYARWLAAATRPGRLLATKHAAAHPRPMTVVTGMGPFWTGTTLSGKPSYISVEGNISVPAAIPGGDEIGNTQIALWNGLDGSKGLQNITGSGLIQGGYQLQANSLTANYFTFREYCCGDPDSNGYSGDFSPNPGDTFYSQEWYCDSRGNKKLNGGYGCTHLHDLTTGAILDCTSATSTICWSVKALPLCSVSPNTPNCMTIGNEADFVIELQGPGWPDLASEVTMTGSSYSSATKSYSQTVSSDPIVNVLTDFGPGPSDVHTETGSHMHVSLGTTDETYFTVSQFAQVSGIADTNPSAQVIAVGPNANGSTSGDPWLLGSQPNADGDYPIYHWVNGAWVKVSGAATQIAVSPTGFAWVINHLGDIYYWNGVSFSLAPGHGCATQIAVGPDAFGSRFGDPWVTGCQLQSNGYGIYRLEGSAWVQQPGAAMKIAIGPLGPWIIGKTGAVSFYNGAAYVAAPGQPCATSIAVAPILTPFADVFGDAWITGCDEHTTGHEIYQLQLNAWVKIPGYATQISVSPDFGVPWVVNKTGQIYQ